MKKQIDDLEHQATGLHHELKERRAIAFELMDYSKIEPLARSWGLHPPTCCQVASVTRGDQP